MPTKLEDIRPVLSVSDMEETVLFYCNVLSFECVSRMEGWAALRKDQVELMISLPNAHEPFEKAALTGDKAGVVYPIENFFYGMREFAIRDNNGYILQFGQEISDPADIPRQN
jgi:uncharacterized glyoxalase superfamily protein PhnB